MKVSLVVLLLGVAVCSGNYIPSLLEYKEGQRFFYFADGKNKLHLIDREAKPEGPETRFDASTDTDLLLYTRTNPSTPYVLKAGNYDSLVQSPFSNGRPTKIIAHGWNSDRNSDINSVVRSAFLNTLDVNVIFVDWSKGSGGLYTIAAGNVPSVGGHVGYLVDWLIVNGARLSDFHIVGHSLGGHVAGIGARKVYSGKVPYVTAFDPALPMWDEKSERIRSSDASYVEIIHTAAGTLGLTDAVGHNDFYPNGGSGQPGCSIDIACSHSRSYLYFANSLDHTGFQAKKCNSVSEATGNKCANIGTLHMGGSKPKSGTGVYRLETNSAVPYYKG